MANDVDALRREIESLKKQVAGNSETLAESAKAKLADWKDSASAGFARAGEHAGEFVRERPGASVLGAAAVGALTAYLVSRKL